MKAGKEGSWPGPGPSGVLRRDETQLHFSPKLPSNLRPNPDGSLDVLGSSAHPPIGLCPNSHLSSSFSPNSAPVLRGASTTQAPALHPAWPRTFKTSSSWTPRETTTSRVEGRGQAVMGTTPGEKTLSTHVSTQLPGLCSLSPSCRFLCLPEASVPFTVVGLFKYLL